MGDTKIIDDVTLKEEKLHIPTFYIKASVKTIPEGYHLENIFGFSKIDNKECDPRREILIETGLPWGTLHLQALNYERKWVLFSFSPNWEKCFSYEVCQEMKDDKRRQQIEINKISRIALRKTLEEIRNYYQVRHPDKINPKVRIKVFDLESIVDKI